MTNRTEKYDFSCFSYRHKNQMNFKSIFISFEIIKEITPPGKTKANCTVNFVRINLKRKLFFKCVISDMNHCLLERDQQFIRSIQFKSNF